MLGAFISSARVAGGRRTEVHGFVTSTHFVSVFPSSAWNVVTVVSVLTSSRSWRVSLVLFIYLVYLFTYQFIYIKVPSRV